jgi:putative flavoprotein involved in K+ transport
VPTAQTAITKDVVIVGAGQAGLGVSYYLAQKGIDHVVLEKGLPGETWRSQRWDSFALNTDNSTTNMPGTSFHPERPEAFELTRALTDHFDRYIAEMALPVRTGVQVTAVQRSGDAASFTLSSSAGRFEARAVVVASGIQNVPKFPAIADRQPEAIAKHHTASYRNPAQLPAGAVMVVGGGQSGCQIVEELVAAGRTVYLATSRVGRVRRYYRGRDILAWWAANGFFAQGIADLADPAEQHNRQPMISGTEGGHTISLQALWRSGARLTGRLRGFEGSVASFDDNLGDNIAFADGLPARILGRIDDYIESAGIDAPAREDDSIDDVDAEALKLHSPASVDLSEAGVTSIVWSTGFGGDFAYIDVEGALDGRGLPVHNGGVSPVPGLFYMGFPWLRTRASGVILGIPDDAEAIAGEVQRALG